MLNTLLHQLWLTVMVFPLRPSIGDRHQFDTQALQREFDLLGREHHIYLKLKGHYSRFAAHFQGQGLKPAGQLLKEGVSWLKWMEVLRQHVFWMGDQAATAREAWPTFEAAHFMVRLFVLVCFCKLSGTDPGWCSCACLIRQASLYRRQRWRRL